MPAPDIAISKGWVLITSSASVLGITPIDAVQFATVALANDASENFSAGDAVMFFPERGRKLIYGSTYYILIEEQNVSGREIAAP
jgi:hypothetical protein